MFLSNFSGRPISSLLDSIPFLLFCYYPPIVDSAPSHQLDTASPLPFSITESLVRNHSIGLPETLGTYLWYYRSPRSSRIFCPYMQMCFTPSYNIDYPVSRITMSFWPKIQLSKNSCPQPPVYHDFHRYKSQTWQATARGNRRKDQQGVCW